jgi:recombination protein RecT
MGRDLAPRAAAQRNMTTPSSGSDDEAEPLTLEQQIGKMRSSFQLAMPRGNEAGQLVRDALTCLRTTNDLAKCEAKSVLGGLMTCAQLGLRPGVGSLGHAWLIPFWDRHAGPERNGRPMGGFRAQLIIGYKGYTDLAYRHPKVVSIASRVVYTNDEFKIGFNLEGDYLEHKPYLDGLRGEPRNYYAIARLQGGYALTEPWSQAEMEAHRDRFAMAKKDGQIVGPWNDHFIEMGRKTMIRVPLLKMIPISTELATAMEVDEGVRIDLNPEADPAEVTTHPTIEGELERTDGQPAAPDQPAGGQPAPLAAADAEAAKQARTERGGTG